MVEAAQEQKIRVGVGFLGAWCWLQVQEVSLHRQKW